MVAASDSVPVFVTIPEPHYISADLLEPRLGSSDLLDPCLVSSHLLEPCLIPADLRNHCLFSVDLPEPLDVLSTIPESRPMVVAIPEPCFVLSGKTIIKRQRLASRLKDPPLPRLAAMPEPSEIAALAIMATAIWCVWAAHTSAPVHESSPEPDPVHEFTTEPALT
ncbi:hypothetical protein DPX16_0102 [Anabarilius grahami]|uniref:Uncharacterized protein n=1 Tax=Anabarilius grahami TaxID=495550 RepID=A0A3N0Z4Q4_ANAGA|nr:hypothetical protein DPX16_0102 [Anabarilius grahami]